MLILAVCLVFALLLINEFWWRRRAVHGEFSRKFIHISVGTFVAFWPFFLSWHQIEFLSIAFLVVVTISKQLNLFQAIHSVTRPTWGELLFALSVGGVVLITHNKWIYAASLLQMSLADGFAAIVGIRYGGGHKYSVFGSAKSLIGTATFCIISIAILITFKASGHLDTDYAFLFVITAIAGLVENLAPRGFDNLLVPVLVAALLVNG